MTIRTEVESKEVHYTAYYKACRSSNKLIADSITVTESIRSLGVTINSSLSFNTHVNEVCKAVQER